VRAPFFDVRRSRRRSNVWWLDPAWAWVAAFVGCVTADALLGQWVLLPIFVVGFYEGMLVVALLIYPALEWWRGWMRPHGVRVWCLTAVSLWTCVAFALTLLSPRWLAWGWNGKVPLQAAGALMLALSVSVGAWAMGKMGWPRLLLVPALFPPGAGAEENRVPQRLVVEGPYRYVRNPVYDLDVGVIFGTALLTSSWWLVILAAVYLAQLKMQLRMEERELRARFGEAYVRYCRLVPRFVPRRTPVGHAEVTRCLASGSRRRSAAISGS
jgi:protein-S-isoprenylcysteine O-methyltransferase Ste14